MNIIFSLRLSILMCAAMLLSACDQNTSVPTPTKTLPALAKLEIATRIIAQEVKYDGVIEATQQATVSAQTSGRIVEIPVDVGDYVAKGDLIIRFTDTEQKARAASAQAQFTEAEAAYKRMQEMLAKKLIAKADFDKSEAAFKSAEANLREAEQNLAYTTIYAPYAGIVVSRAVNLGETVAPGSLLMTGLSLEQLRAQVDIPQQHIGPVRKFKQARIYLSDGTILTSDKLRIPPSADAQSHSFKVLVNLPEGDHPLYPGTFVKIGFVIGTAEQLFVPANAVSKRGELSGVYVIKENQLEFRLLNIGGLTPDGLLPVLAGLDAGETIATDPIAAANAYRQLHGAE
jgi:RND family efflux transporter MFP subunit